MGALFMQAPSNGASWYLFLDIDGVLNSNVSRTSRMKRPGCTMLQAGIPSEDHLLLLERLVSAVSSLATCRIVLSSTWRLDPADREEVVRALSTIGLTLFGDTPDLGISSNRVHEIRNWLSENVAGSIYIGTISVDASPVWLAIDDMPLLNYSLEGELIDDDHFERTYDTDGLSEDNVASAVAKLQRQLRLKA